MLRPAVLACVCTLFAAGLSSAAPPAEREWTSTAGTRIRAIAVAVADGKVQLKASDGRELSVPLDKLIESDRALLAEHFELVSTAPGRGGGSAEAAGSDSSPATGLPHPVGEITGPIDTPQGSKYFVYLPATLKQGRQAPLLFFTSAGGGRQSVVARMTEGAEINGWIAACSVDSRNANSFEINHEHSKNCVGHILGTLPVDKDRVYFTGGSGGGATSLYNAGRMDHAGAIPMIGYIPPDTTVGGGDYFFINGARDYNRYTSASAREEVGDSTIHRFHPGGHSMGPEWIMTDAIAWLNGRYLSEKGQNLARERLDYEASMIEWIGALREDEPWRAYYWAEFLAEDYKVESSNQPVVETLVAELGADETNLRYANGIRALDDFGREQFAGVTEGSRYGYTTQQGTRAATALAKKFAGVPHIEETARALAEPSVERKGK